MSTRNVYRWMRGYVSEPGIASVDRVLRWGCVVVTIMIVGVLLHGLTLHSLRAVGVGPLALAQEGDMLQAINACPGVRGSLQGFRAAPSRRDVQELVTRCRDLEPLRRALVASAR